MRELTTRETEQVAGGAIGLATGALGAVLGGGFTGAGYAAQAAIDGDFSWGQFTFIVASNAASGFLIGSGAALVGAAATGVAQGTTVMGVSMIGLGGAISVAANVSEPGEKKAGS